MMKYSDFQIGREFWTATGPWRCTDIGTRTIAAIKLDQDDPARYNGPPYGIVESVFDEYDLEGSYPSEENRNSEIGPPDSLDPGPTKHLPNGGDFELRTAFVAAVANSSKLGRPPLGQSKNIKTLTDRERGIAAGAIRYFAALFYQELGQFDHDNPIVWEYAMDELADVSNCQKGRRTKRDYVDEVLLEPDIVIASGDDN
jgi:hypothetical protein